MIYGNSPAYLEQGATSSVAPMVNGMTLFNFKGDIEIMDLWAACVTGNGVTASTLQYAATVTGLAQQTISGASATLASALAGTVVALDGTALTTAPNIYVKAVGLGQVGRGINLYGGGTINAVIGVGSTTGNWIHYIRWRPISNRTASVAGV